MTDTPKLRIDAYYDLQTIITESLNKLAEQNHIYRSCINCINFNQRQELCWLVKQKPPAKVIVFGCPKWEDKDQIPF